MKDKPWLDLATPGCMIGNTTTLHIFSHLVFYNTPWNGYTLLSQLKRFRNYVYSIFAGKKIQVVYMLINGRDHDSTMGWYFSPFESTTKHKTFHKSKYLEWPLVSIWWNFWFLRKFRPNLHNKVGTHASLWGPGLWDNAVSFYCKTVLLAQTHVDQASLRPLILLYQVHQETGANLVYMKLGLWKSGVPVSVDLKGTNYMAYKQHLKNKTT